MLTPRPRESLNHPDGIACSITLTGEIMKNPMQLPCLHAFEEKSLETWWQTKTGGNKTKKCPCPTCKKGFIFSDIKPATAVRKAIEAYEATFVEHEKLKKQNANTLSSINLDVKELSTSTHNAEVMKKGQKMVLLDLSIKTTVKKYAYQLLLIWGFQFQLKKITRQLQQKLKDFLPIYRKYKKELRDFETDLKPLTRATDIHQLVLQNVKQKDEKHENKSLKARIIDRVLQLDLDDQLFSNIEIDLKNIRMLQLQILFYCCKIKINATKTTPILQQLIALREQKIEFHQEILDKEKRRLMKTASHLENHPNFSKLTLAEKMMYEEALVLAVSVNFLSHTLHLLQKQDIDPNTPLMAKTKLQPIFQAIANDNNEMVSVLVEAKANVNSLNSQSISTSYKYFPAQSTNPIFMSISLSPFSKNTAAIVKILLKAKADVNTPIGVDLQTPLHIAKVKCPALVNLLLEHKADPTLKNWHNQTPDQYKEDIGRITGSISRFDTTRLRR